MNSIHKIQMFLDLLADDYPHAAHDFNRLFRTFRTNGQRIGQAFVNVLPPPYYEELSESLFDPFHKSDYQSVLDAIDFLTGGKR